MIVKSKEKYKPANKTVVTEIKHFVVDKVRRVGSGRFTVAASSNDNTLTQTDVVVDADNPYTLKDVHKIVSISCPNMVYAELTGFGEIPEPETRTEQIYYDASLTAEDFEAGTFLHISVEDQDNYANSIEVSVQNMRTLETETATLIAVGRGRYKGTMSTREIGTAGNDFDGVLSCHAQDIINVTYVEPSNAQGLTESHSATVTCIEPEGKYTKLEVATTFPYNSELTYRTDSGNATTIRNTRSGYVIVQLASQPIMLADEDSMTSMQIEDGDIIELTTLGQTPNGIENILAHTQIGNAAPPQIQSEDHVAFDAELEVTILDNSMKNVVVSVNGMGIVAVPTYYNSGVYKAKIKPANVNMLPGQRMHITYGTALKEVYVLPNETECRPKTEFYDQQLTRPVTLKIDGHLFLNGSFAGTIKLWADEPTRITLIKS